MLNVGACTLSVHACEFFVDRCTKNFGAARVLVGECEEKYSYGTSDAIRIEDGFGWIRSLLCAMGYGLACKSVRTKLMQK